ncbi:hypothetical protein JTE90_012396 [Oedothorax gibbosus]|uniref:Uncharacterized protein n=1 Tax=Oedothorax gibbosus TaxID=931172 RepID=A0AAV6TWX8_9ARAC|nr:hypothetical protein JTE90_012396 [Oedothorax gibbosus]
MLLNDPGYPWSPVFTSPRPLCTPPHIWFARAHGLFCRVALTLTTSASGPPPPGYDPPGDPTQDVDWSGRVPPAIFPDERLMFLGDARPSTFQQKFIDTFINLSTIENLDDQITIFTAELQQALRKPARRRRSPVTAAIPPNLSDALNRQGAQTSTFFNNGLSAYDKV